MTKFKDVGKASNDLLNNDYLFMAQKLKVKTRSPNGVEFTTEATLKGSKGVSGKLSSAFTPFEGIKVSKLCVTTGGRFQTEASLTNTGVDGVKVTVKAEEGADQPPAGELCVDYANSNTVVNTSVDVCDANGPTLYGAATFSHGNFLVGGEVRYSTGFDSEAGSAALTDYNAVAQYKDEDWVAAIKTKKCASAVSVSVHKTMSKDVQYCTEYNHASNLLSLGGIYKLDGSTKLQGKVNSKGTVSANAIQQISAGVKLISSVELDAKNFAGDSHKFGLQIVLG